MKAFLLKLKQISSPCAVAVMMLLIAKCLEAGTHGSTAGLANSTTQDLPALSKFCQ